MRKYYKFNNVYINNTAAVCGPLEYEGNLGEYMDKHYDDLRLDEKSFELAEMDFQKDALNILFSKTMELISNIDVVIGGDLVNQEVISHYTLRNYDIPFIGVYGACSTSILSIINASFMLESKLIDKAICLTSSHNLSSERQFRNPVEYGGAKNEYQTYTVSGACAALVTNRKKGVRVVGCTIGRIIDFGFKDSQDMGRAMAPAAIETILDYLTGSNKTPSDFDLILTGDLSFYGSEIVYKALEKRYGIIKNYNDCGNLIYKPNQEVFAGGSGCACCGITLYGYIFKKMLNHDLKRVLICGTGALMNSDITLQKQSIPAICHCIELEVVM